MINPTILAICGGSGSGKSTLAKALVESFGPEKAVRLPTDLFLQPNPYPTIVDFRRQPLKYDWSLLVEMVSSGSQVEVGLPEFDFTTFQRISRFGGKRIILAPLVILDGMLPFPSSDYTVLVHVPDTIRQERIRARDVRWKTHVIDAWEQHQLTLTKLYENPPVYDLVIDGESDIDVNVALIKQFLIRKNSPRVW